jgi:pyruvate,water dikinase
MGFDSIPIKAEKALYDLAGWCREQTNALTDYLIAAPADQITVQIERDLPRKVFQTNNGKSFEAALRQYLKNTVIQFITWTLPNPCQSTNLSNPETFKLFLTVQGKDPYERQQLHAGRRRRRWPRCERA